MHYSMQLCMLFCAWRVFLALYLCVYHGYPYLFRNIHLVEDNYSVDEGGIKQTIICSIWYIRYSVYFKIKIFFCAFKIRRTKTVFLSLSFFNSSIVMESGVTVHLAIVGVWFFSDLRLILSYKSINPSDSMKILLTHRFSKCFHFIVSNE